ncbi:MAG: hypothetical protein ABI969_13665 [bacterium]
MTFICFRPTDRIRFCKMLRPHWWFRLFILLFAAGQVALPATLSISDAIASDDGRASRSHIEDLSGPGCKAPHAGDCSICRYLSALVGSAPAAAVEIPGLIRGELAGLARVATASNRQHGFLSRAPPELSA